MIINQFIFLLVISWLGVTLHASEIKLQSMPEYVNFLEKFKKLQGIKTKDEMRSITTLGLVTGSLQVQKSMRDNLSEMVGDLLDNMDLSDSKKTIPKIRKIEEIVRRDKRAVIILGNALDVAKGDASIDEFRSKMKKMMREYEGEKRQPFIKNATQSVEDKMEKLKESLTEQVKMMKKMIKEKSLATLEYLGEKHGISMGKSRKSQAENISFGQLSAPELDIVPLLLEPIDDNIIDDVRRQDLVEDEMALNTTNEPTKIPPNSNVEPERQTEDKDSTPEFSIEVSVGSNDGTPPGGLLAGLLSGLSGGDGGSDVGALVGALTGVVMNLFGPGGLDIPSLLSGGSALLAGLLSNNRNFGTVLGEYVGLTIDGFSGGGGAINNGKFFGNLVGTVIAELSADPEDDDLPPKPLIFLQNFLSSLSQAEMKSNEASESMAGTDQSSFGFITQILKSIVNGITQFIFHASSSSSSSGSSNRSSANHRLR